MQLQLFYDMCVKWLMESPIRRKDGAVYSWVNKEKPGYVYPEIIGYSIKFFADLYDRTRQQAYLTLAQESADYLSTHLSRNGSVGRDGYDYAFDSAICASGLIGLSKVHSLDEAQERALSRLAHFIFTSLSNHQSVLKDGTAVVDNDRWSLSWGALLAKNAIALHELSEHYKDDKYKALADNLFALTKQCFHEDHFCINGERPCVYTHPHCYATEGLIFLATKGYPVQDMVLKSAQWLSPNQQENGAMKSWYYRDAPTEYQGDATAQAIRIWVCADNKRYKRNIEKAFGFLASLQTKEGGLAYNIADGKTSKDINSWVTLFAAQAAQWHLQGPRKNWIV